MNLETERLDKPKYECTGAYNTWNCLFREGKYCYRKKYPCTYQAEIEVKK